MSDSENQTTVDQITSTEIDAKINALPALSSRGPVPALDREATKKWVLRTFTAEAGLPVLSSVVAEVSSLSEDERARLRLARLQVLNTSQMTTSGGVVTAPTATGGSPTSPSGSPSSPEKSQHQDANAAATAAGTGGDKGISVSQNEIVHMLETMDSELKRHWNAGDSVKALRLAIQSTKMLAHASRVPECFPSMFVLVATVLDSLGDRVADRLAERAIKFDPIIERLLAEGRTDFPHVPPEAAELCGNWFHKILSIRELLCRVTVELALLKCFKYAGEKSRVPAKQVIVRLGQQIRGVANPQVASHLRWYLFLRARDELATRGSAKKSDSWAHSLALCAFDNLEMMSRMQLPGPLGSADSVKFVSTFQPSLRWMFDTIIRFGGSASSAFVEEVLTFISESEQLQFGSVAAVFLQCAPAEFLFRNLERVWEFLENDIKYYSTEHSKLRCLGELLAALADPASGVAKLSKSKRANILNLLFGAIVENQQFGTIEAHFHALVAAIQFTSRYLPFSAVVTVLDEIRRLVDVLEDKANEHLLKTIGGSSVVEEQVTTVIRWVVECVSPDAYIPCAQFVNLLLTTGSLSSDRRKLLVEFVLTKAAHGITVPTVAQSAFELCRVLHDGLPPTANFEQIEAVESIVNRIVGKTFTPNAAPESLLRFYSECRHVLHRFSSLRRMILYEALRIVVAVPANQLQKKRQQLRPCLAFVHATCPAVTSPLDRARVAADAACVAYERGFVAQGEALLETALISLTEIPAVGRTAQTSLSAGSIRYNDAAAVEVARQLIHVGIVMPPPLNAAAAAATTTTTASSSSESVAMMTVVDNILKWATDTFGWNDRSQPCKLAATTLSLLAKAKLGLLMQQHQQSQGEKDNNKENIINVNGSEEEEEGDGAGNNNNNNKRQCGESLAKQYRFSALSRVALHKIPEYLEACSILQLKAVALLEKHMPCEESNDGVEVAETILNTFINTTKFIASSSSATVKTNNRSDAFLHTALHLSFSPLLRGLYANAESHYEAFRIAKASLLSRLEETCKDENYFAAFASLGDDLDGMKVLNNIKNGSGTADYKQFENVLAAQNDEEAI